MILVVRFKAFKKAKIRAFIKFYKNKLIIVIKTNIILFLLKK